MGELRKKFIERLARPHEYDAFAPTIQRKSLRRTQFLPKLPTPSQELTEIGNKLYVETETAKE